MRLTQQLLEFSKTFWYKNIWKKKGKTSITKMDFRPAMKSLGVEPVDPLKDEDLFGVAKTKVWIPPNDPRFMFPPRPEDHVDWHPSKAHTCSSNTKLWEGLPQVQILTNTVVEHGLPGDVVSHSDQLSSPNQDHLIQRTILQANLWDTERIKLPKREAPPKSIWKFKTEYGISENRTIEILYSGITRLCSQLLAIKDPSLMKSRRVLQDHCLNTHYTFEKQAIYLTSSSQALLTSSTPLSRFAHKDQVLATKDSTIQSIWPITPFVDLDQSNLYKTEEGLGYTPDYKYSHHHTLFFAHSKDWTLDQRHANAILMSYAHCLQLARHHGITDSLMNEPVCVQTVHTNGESFGYTCFQLNTLDSCTDDSNRGYGSRRNMAWVDDDLLFVKNVPKRSMLRDTKYSEYNPAVFRKILGLFAR